MPGCFAKPRNFGWSNDFCWPAVSTKERNTSPGHQSQEHPGLSDDWGRWHHGHGTNTFILWAHITLWICDEIEPITNNIMQLYQTIMLLNFNHLDIHNVLTWLTKQQLYTLDFSAKRIMDDDSHQLPPIFMSRDMSTKARVMRWSWGMRGPNSARMSWTFTADPKRTKLN